MNLVILTFFSLYALTHLYVFFKAKAAFAFNSRIGILLAAFLVLMAAGPFIIHFSERSGLRTSAMIMAHIGYTWLGVMFLFFAFSLSVEIYHVLLYCGGYIFRRNPSSIRLSVRYAFIIPLFFSFLAAVYGYYEANDIRTERISIQTPKIPSEIGRLRIVQISDMHLGLIIREYRLKRILEKVRLANPDLIVSTGDLVDGQICDSNALSDFLRELSPKYGKFAITGNHEFIAGLEQAKCFIENAGFTLLRGEGITVGGIINIAGVDDPAGKRFGYGSEAPEQMVLSGMPGDKFTLFLKHRPLIEKESLDLFDLQLSGHVHKGQIFPFSILTGLYYPVQAGLRDLGKAFLYVSRGTGTWGPPIRVLAPPEITVIDLIHGHSQKSRAQITETAPE